MIPNKLKSYFLFSREHRSGIFLLIGILIIFQIFIFTVNFTTLFQKESSDDFTSSQWLAIQHEIDSLKKTTLEKKYEIKPFNPNFITDYKGYILGISVEELNRLQAFRNQGRYVNSAKEFQQVTQVSDEVLNKISPYFKFPDWVINKDNSKEGKHQFFESKKAKVISELTRDISEYIFESLKLDIKEKNKKYKVAYHSACSMQHGQKVHSQPIALLEKTNNEILEIPEGHICCGSAGTYNILQSEIAKQLLTKKVDNIESLKPDFISTGNIGCITRISHGTKVPIVHTIKF